MRILTESMIRLGAHATDKVDAIRQSGELLVEAGVVAPAYVDGMLARERAMSNYISNGVAIPHGENQDLALVHRAGVSVLQVPEGVEWDPGAKVYLVIGLAARSDELAGILRNLVDLLQDPDAVEQLSHTSDPMTIMERLSGSQDEPAKDSGNGASV